VRFLLGWRLMRQTRCRDCRWQTLSAKPGVRCESYMVTDDVWTAAGDPQGFLCIGCLEARIGRRLTRADFDDVMMNDLSITDADYAWSWRSDRLRDRLSA
jgi:hypothetical protein